LLAYVLFAIYAHDIKTCALRNNVHIVVVVVLVVVVPVVVAVNLIYTSRFCYCIYM